MLPTATTTSGACGWMSLTRCKETSRYDLSSLGGGLEGVGKKPMAKQRNLEPRPGTYGELDEEISADYPYLLLRRIQDGRQAEDGMDFSPTASRLFWTGSPLRKLRP